VVEQVPDSPPGRVPHRHDFEERFTVLGGEIEAMFRGKKVVVRAGQTINVRPTRRPRSPTTWTSLRACFACARRRGLEEFFLAVGVLVGSRTPPPPKPSKAEQEAPRRRPRRSLRDTGRSC
jgi:hypothetical protein